MIAAYLLSLFFTSVVCLMDMELNKEYSLPDNKTTLDYILSIDFEQMKNYLIFDFESNSEHTACYIVSLYITVRIIQFIIFL